jgi:hypothetical protein
LILCSKITAAVLDERNKLAMLRLRDFHALPDDHHVSLNFVACPRITHESTKAAAHEIVHEVLAKVLALEVWDWHPADLRGEGRMSLVDPRWKHRKGLVQFGGALACGKQGSVHLLVAVGLIHALKNTTTVPHCVNLRAVIVTTGHVLQAESLVEITLRCLNQLLNLLEHPKICRVSIAFKFLCLLRAIDLS